MDYFAANYDFQIDVNTEFHKSKSFRLYMIMQHVLSITVRSYMGAESTSIEFVETLSDFKYFQCETM